MGDDEEWTVYWTDTSVLLERVMEMKRYQVGALPQDNKEKIKYEQLKSFLQKINHFPGMIEICRKDLLARNMNRMFKLFPKDYNCFPRSWCMPAE